MTINEIQNQIIEDFGMYEEWMDKYEYIIELGGGLAKFDDTNKTPSNIIEGCQSRVWLDAELKDGKIIFFADADAIITKGIIALLIQVLSDRTPQEILDSDLYFIDKIGLKQNLSPTRANGLVSMIKKIRTYALAYKEISKN